MADKSQADLLQEAAQRVAAMNGEYADTERHYVKAVWWRRLLRAFHICDAEDEDVYALYKEAPVTGLFLCSRKLRQHH
mgnify:CR=1 FL=1